MSFPFNGSFDIGSSIDIVCMDALGEASQGEVGLGQKAYVNEVSGGTTVGEGSGFNNLSSSTSLMERQMVLSLDKATSTWERSWKKDIKVTS